MSILFLDVVFVAFLPRPLAGVQPIDLESTTSGNLSSVAGALRLEVYFGQVPKMKSLGRLTFLLFPLLGCYSDSAAPVPVTVPGRYVLRTLDDQPLPAVYADQPNFRLEFIRGVVTLQKDLSFTDSTEIRRTENQLARRVVDVAEGTYTRDGVNVNLSSTRGERYTMTFGGRTLTQRLGGATLVYHK